MQVLDDVDAKAAQIGSGDAAHFGNAHGSFHKLGHVHAVRSGADFVVGVGNHAGVAGVAGGIHAVLGDQLVKIDAVKVLLVDLFDLVGHGGKDGGLGFVDLLEGHGRFGGVRFFFAFGSGSLLLFIASLQVGVGVHEGLVDGQQDVAHGAESVGFVPGVIHVVLHAVHGGVVGHHVHLAVVGHVGGNVAFVQLLVSGDQFLIQGVQLLVGNHGVLNHDGLHLVQHGVLFVFGGHGLQIKAAVRIVGCGLGLGSGDFLGGAFGGEIGIVVGQIIVDGGGPVGRDGGFNLGHFLGTQLAQAHLNGLLHHGLFNDGVVQRHGAEEAHVGGVGHVIIAAVLADQRVIAQLHIGPGHVFAVQGGHDGVGGQLGNGVDGGFGGGDGVGGFFSHGGHAQHHAQAQQQGCDFAKIVHVVLRSFQPE